MTSSSNSVVLSMSPDDAFRLVCDPALYPQWLVGAQTIRRIDPDWPAVGSTFEHRIGIGPAAIPGSTTVRRIEAPGLLELAAGMGLLGESTVVFELRPVAGGTEVRIVETPKKGLASLASKIMSPLVRGALWGRNQASLAELEKLAKDAVPTAGSGT